jgi:hypothetical protein
LDALDEWTRQRPPVLDSDVLANKESASTRSAISVPQSFGIVDHHPQESPATRMLVDSDGILGRHSFARARILQRILSIG